MCVCVEGEREMGGMREGDTYTFVHDFSGCGYLHMCTSFSAYFVPNEMFYIKLQTFLFPVSPHSAAGVTWLVSLKFSCAMDYGKRATAQSC